MTGLLRKAPALRSPGPPTISLVVASRGRTHALPRLLRSIADAPVDAEVVVVDQNDDARLQAILESSGAGLRLTHVRCEPGASRSRNLGAAVARGDVLAFPDDDCFFPDGMLPRALATLRERSGADAVLGRFVTPDGREGLPWSDRAGWLTPVMSWRRSVTFACFWSRRTFEAVGGFDERIGPGADPDWVSGEDNDVTLRALSAGARIWFEPALAIAHPPLFPDHTQGTMTKRLHYAIGDGRLLRRHPMPPWFHAPFFGMPAARAAWALARGKVTESRAHLTTLRGRTRGFWRASLEPMPSAALFARGRVDAVPETVERAI